MATNSIESAQGVEPTISLHISSLKEALNSYFEEAGMVGGAKHRDTLVAEVLNSLFISNLADSETNIIRPRLVALTLRENEQGHKDFFCSSKNKDGAQRTRSNRFVSRNSNNL